MSNNASLLDIRIKTKRYTVYKIKNIPEQILYKNINTEEKQNKTKTKNRAGGHHLAGINGAVNIPVNIVTQRKEVHIASTCPS